jgi:Zn-dependent protease with chaperone function
MKHFLIIFLLISKAVISQVYKPIEFPAKADKKYVIDPIKDEEKYRKKVQKKIPSRYLKSYTHAVTYGKSHMFRNGEVYMSWDGMETYVNKILDSILPANLASRKIHVYIGRSSEINAYCMYDGTMIINAGMIAEVKNEAALVAIMGHELAHYSKNHILNEYVKSVKKKKKVKASNELKLAIEKRGYEQKLELEADAIGYDIAKGANYDLNEAFSNFEIFIREKEYYNKRQKSELANTDSIQVKVGKSRMTANTLEKLLSTHPDEKERKDKLTEYIKSNPQTKKKIYKIDEDLFKALQKQARLETINKLFENHNYKECLERAFVYHLFDPANTTYMYYIAECIRRECLFDYTIKKKGFLTYNMETAGINKELGILQDLHYMVVDENRYKAIKATELLDKAAYEFKTYSEAYYYFAGLLEKSNFTEVYLMNALFENNKEKIKTNIDKYLASPSAERKEYAKHYRDGTLTKVIETNDGELVLVPRVDYYSHTTSKSPGQGLLYDYKYSEIYGSILADKICDKISGDGKIRTVSIPRETVSNFNSKIRYENIMATSMLASRDENEGINVVHYYKELENEEYVGNLDLFRLSPDVWQFFHGNKIRTISFTTFSAHEFRAGKRMRLWLLILAVPTAGATLAYVPFVPVRYEELDMYTYNPKMGAVLKNEEYKRRRTTTRKSHKLFKRSKKHLDKYIDNYDRKK